MNRPVLILRHMPQETGGTLEAALTAAGLSLRYVDLFQETPSRLPLDEAAGLVVLGGPMNVDQVDRYPFLALDVQWIRQALEIRLPLLGICLGAQLLAKALGARVYANSVKEIGWYPIEWLSAAADDRLFAQSGTTGDCPDFRFNENGTVPLGPRSTMVYQSHGDTFDLPPEAVQLARGSSCRNQAFRWGANAYGLQFHIEMTAEMIEQWLSEGETSGGLAALDYIDSRQIRQRTPLLLPGMQRLAADVFQRFAKMCLDRPTSCLPSRS
jgi:GMP synthase (glutamine-hydrolysing)